VQLKTFTHRSSPAKRARAVAALTPCGDDERTAPGRPASGKPGLDGGSDASPAGASKNATCPLGSDCKDCGPRREVCTEVRAGHENGVCEDGSARSTESTCALRTDCIDCRPRVTYR
jgi:hypothetical protein